jgi:hypothetical protein
VEGSCWLLLLDEDVVDEELVLLLETVGEAVVVVEVGDVVPVPTSVRNLSTKSS